MTIGLIKEIIMTTEDTILDVLNAWGITNPTLEDIEWANTMSKDECELNQDDIDFMNSLSPYEEGFEDDLEESDFWLDEDRWYPEEDII